MTVNMGTEEMLQHYRLIIDPTTYFDCLRKYEEKHGKGSATTHAVENVKKLREEFKDLP